MGDYTLAIKKLPHHHDVGAPMHLIFTYELILSINTNAFQLEYKRNVILVPFLKVS